MFPAINQVRTDVRPICLASLKQAAVELNPPTSTALRTAASSAMMSSISWRAGNAEASNGVRTAWTAPELLVTGQPSTKTDVYALGITIWELFAKSNPYGEYGCRDPMELPSLLVQDIVCSDLRPTMPCTMPETIKEAVVDCLSKVRTAALALPVHRGRRGLCSWNSCPLQPHA